MVDEFTLDEKNIPEIHHVGFFGKMKVRLVELKMKWDKLDSEEKVKLGIRVGVGVVVGLVLVSVVLLIVLPGDSSNDPNNSANLNPNSEQVDPAAPELPKDHMSPLTGEMITKDEFVEITQRPVMTVVVENHPTARPQSGLDQADIVYEMLVEGGITRFVGVFFSQEPDVVGPVRSARKYFIDLIGEFDNPVFVHIGYAQTNNPSTNALGEMIAQGVRRLGSSSGEYWRVSYRSAPHNAYVNLQTLWEKAKVKGWTEIPNFDVWSFQDAADIEASEDLVDKIMLNWGDRGENTWSVTWEFDQAENRYKRYIGKDVVHYDAVTNEQLTTRNVIILKVNQYPANDEANRIIIDVAGQGDALVFNDGAVIEGGWERPSRTDRYLITNQSGDEVVFNRGTSWIMLVPINSAISYQ